MRPSLRALCCALVLTLLAAACSSPDESAPTTTPQSGPREIHVSPNGRDGAPGTAQSPVGSVGEGLEMLGPGDTLIVHDGQYREKIDLREPARGTEDDPITVRAAAGERPVVVGLLWLHDLEHWVIDSLHVTWDDERNEPDDHMVKLDGGANWVFRNSEVWGAQSYAGILVAGEPVDFLLTGLYVHDTVPTNDRNEDHLVYLNSGSGGGVLERSLLVGSANGRAVKVGGASPDDDEVANVVIRQNTMVDNRGPSNVQLAWNTSNIVVERNIMVGADADRANVTTFELAGTGSVIRDNIGWQSTGLLEPAEGVEDGGLNRWIDPTLSTDGRYRPTNAAAMAHGHLGVDPVPTTEQTEEAPLE